MKREVMRNKNKLRGKIFFENDLSFEERKTQNRINKWVKAQENKGGDIKIGYRRVKIRGIWKTWAEIERGEEEKRENKNNNKKYEDRERKEKNKLRETVEEEQNLC